MFNPFKAHLARTLVLTAVIVGAFGLFSSSEVWAQGNSGAAQSLEDLPPAAGVQAPAPVIERSIGSSESGDQAQASESACLSTAKMTANVCLLPGAHGMEPQEQMAYSFQMNMVQTMVAQAAAIGKNASAQCDIQSKIATALGAVNGVKSVACAGYVSRCKSVCTEEMETATASQDVRKARQAKENLGACAGYSSQVAMMGMQAMQQGLSALANNQCAKDLASANTTPTPATDYDPSNCEDPRNQYIYACYCAKELNKTTAMCVAGGGVNPGGGSVSPTGPGNGTTNAATPYTPILDESTDDGLEMLSREAASRGGGGGGMGDGGSGAPGGGGLSALGDGGGGGGAPGDPRSAITGTAGGSSNSLGSAGGGGGGGGLARNNNGAGGGGVLDKLNLKKFLPKSNYANRGIAGMSVKSVDGITGPMGPSLWEKATRQYQEQIQKQNVILDK
ncbi:MAG: hypothetical protein RBT63_02995 [Bdellovibrionales bacterium]|nr:hypothetical protein [Bdellovibrionales bacterium]